MGEDPHDPVPQLLFRVGRSVDRQVPPFGVTADVQSAFHTGRRFLQVFQRFLLRRNRVAEAHVEIFLPAYQRHIRAAVRNVGTASGQKKSHGSELLLRRRIRDLREAGDAHVPVARVRGHRRQKEETVLRIPGLLEQDRKMLRVVQIRKLYTSVPSPGLLVFFRKIHVGEPGQDQAVDRIERARPEPVQDALRKRYDIIHTVNVWSESDSRSCYSKLMLSRILSPRVPSSMSTRTMPMEMASSSFACPMYSVHS